MGKANELHFNFVDFKAAFDTIWRGALWKVLRSIGVDPKIASLIGAMYDNVECAVDINGQLTQWFRVEIGGNRAVCYHLLSCSVCSWSLSWQTLRAYARSSS